MKLSTSLIILMLSLFMAGCSDETPKVEETVEDIRQEACETVKGDVECAAERAQRDVEEAASDLTN